MALNQLVQKIQQAKCVQIYLLHQNCSQKEPPREASLRLYSPTRYSANPTLSHIINGSGVNSVSAHFQESYGDLSEADGSGGPRDPVYPVWLEDHRFCKSNFHHQHEGSSSQTQYWREYIQERSRWGIRHNQATVYCFHVPKQNRTWSIYLKVSRCSPATHKRLAVLVSKENPSPES